MLEAMRCMFKTHGCSNAIERRDRKKFTECVYTKKSTIANCLVAGSGKYVKITRVIQSFRLRAEIAGQDISARAVAERCRAEDIGTKVTTRCLLLARSTAAGR